MNQVFTSVFCLFTFRSFFFLKCILLQLKLKKFSIPFLVLWHSLQPPAVNCVWSSFDPQYISYLTSAALHFLLNCEPMITVLGRTFFYTYAKSMLLTRYFCLHVLWKTVKKGTEKHGGNFVPLLKPCRDVLLWRDSAAQCWGCVGLDGVCVSTCKQRCSPSLSSCLVRNPATAISSFLYKMQVGEGQNHSLPPCPLSARKGQKLLSRRGRWWPEMWLPACQSPAPPSPCSASVLIRGLHCKEQAADLPFLLGGKSHQSLFSPSTMTVGFGFCLLFFGVLFLVFF